MPSVESQMLTHAIRSAADSRSSSFHAPSSRGPVLHSLLDLPGVEYELNLTEKHLKSGDYDDLKKLLLANDGEIFILNPKAIKSEVCIAPELIYKERRIITFRHRTNDRPVEGHCYYEDFYLKYDDMSSDVIESYQYGSERYTKFYDDNTFLVESGVFVSKSKDSIKKLLDDIFATAKFEHKSIKEITYNALIKWISL